MVDIFAVFLVIVVGYGLGRGLRAWLNAGHFGWPPASRLGWSLVAAVAPSRYWWGARIDALSPSDRSALLAAEMHKLGLEHPADLRCPLCGTEIPGAWALDPSGRVTVATGKVLERPSGPPPSGRRDGGQGEVACPRCDFRLDACRHCAHFLAGGPRSWHAAAWNVPDGTWGRCGHYKRSQPVEDAVDPEMARALKRQGHEEIRAPLRIVDSMLRPDFCRAFTLDPKHLRQASGVRRPGRKRAALLRIVDSEDERPRLEDNESHQHL